MKKKTKGTLFYTIIGLMVIALVAVISLHLLRTTYNPSKADDVHLQRFNDAVYRTQAEMQTLVRYSEYPAVWKAGHSIGPDGINTYLTDSDGRKKLKEDLTKDLTENLNQEMKARSISNASTYYVLPAGDVNV